MLRVLVTELAICGNRGMLMLSSGIRILYRLGYDLCAIADRTLPLKFI